MRVDAVSKQKLLTIIAVDLVIKDVLSKENRTHDIAFVHGQSTLEQLA